MSFVEKRMGVNKDRLVDVTETAILAESKSFYQNLPSDFAPSGKGGDEEDE